MLYGYLCGLKMRILFTWEPVEINLGFSVGKRFLDMDKILEILFVFTNKALYMILRLSPGIILAIVQVVRLGLPTKMNVHE